MMRSGVAIFFSRGPLDFLSAVEKKVRVKEVCPSHSGGVCLWSAPTDPQHFKLLYEEVNFFVYPHLDPVVDSADTLSRTTNDVYDRPSPRQPKQTSCQHFERLLLDYWY
jgi:hypothetical protein